MCLRVAAAATCSAFAATCVSQCNETLARFPLCNEQLLALFTCGGNTSVTCSTTAITYPSCPTQLSAASACIAPMIDAGTPPDASTSDLTRVCTGGTYSGASRDCSWLPGRTFSCTPGRSYTVGCNLTTSTSTGCTSTIGSCSGDPVMRVCSGSAPCTNATALASVDDSCGGTCPVTTVVCPASGSLYVMGGNYSNTMTGTCTPAIR